MPMTAKLEKIENCEAYFEFVIDADEMEEGLEKSYKKVVKELKVQGFRKGTAPRSVVEANFGLEVLLNEALDIVVPDKYYAAVRELELVTAGEPDIEVGYVVKGEPVTVKVMVPLYPQVMLGKLEGLEVTVPQLSAITDKDVDRSLQETLRRNKKITDKKNQPAAVSDQVTIDYEGLVGKRPFQGDKDFKVVIGAENFIPGFEEQLIGAKKGDDLIVNVPFADNHPSKELAGKTAVFKVKIKKVEDVKEVVIDDDFLQNTAHVKTMDEFREQLKQKLSENADKRQQEKIKTAVLAAAVEVSDIQIPESLVMEAATANMQQFVQQLQAEGGTLELYAQMIGKTMEEIKKEFWADAQRSVKINYLLEKIVNEKGFDISEAEHRDGVIDFAQQYNMDTSDYEDLRKRVGPMFERIAMELKSEKAAQYLVDHALISLVDPQDMQSGAKPSKLN
jgi:trigger factor